MAGKSLSPGANRRRAQAGFKSPRPARAALQSRRLNCSSTERPANGMSNGSET